MIGFKAYRSTPTTLDLDGPILSYTQQPTGISTDGSSATLVGIATALPVGTGSISYQWYESGYGPISTSSTITGTATTALTLTQLNYNDDGREFYLQASYDASAYGTGLITAGTARSTGNALNAPLNSDTAKLSLGPYIIILQQPVSSTTTINNDARFNVLASIGSSTGVGVPSPCIAVTDETSTEQYIINQDWDDFRNKWPNRAFNIFWVRRFEGQSSVKLPNNQLLDYNVEYVNDDSAGLAVSDWFNLANLTNYVAGTTVTLWVDTSGSMVLRNVQGSYDKFVADCAAAGINIEFATSSLNSANGIDHERYIWPFIDKLVGTGIAIDPNLIYQWKVNGENAVNSTTRTVSNENTNSLIIKDTVAGIHTVACSISYPGAINQPLLTNVVTYDAAGDDAARSILHLEEFDVNATLYNATVVNLEDGALEITPSTNISVTSDWNRIYSITAPEEDIDVKITMKAAAGGSVGTRSGGQGGVSVWTMTLTNQQEYVVNLGAAIWPSGGDGVDPQPGIGGVGGNGGGGSFFYSGAELLVACGGGGGGGTSNNGENGWGGGIGQNPQLTVSPSPTTDISPSFAGREINAPNNFWRPGGRVSACTIGDYWRLQGIPPCSGIGFTSFFTGKDGQKATSSITIYPLNRGYKAGLNYQYNGGNGSTGGGGGGGGAVGGRGGTGGSSGIDGGAGGLGFTQIAIDSATIGGNTLPVGTIKIEKA